MGTVASLQPCLRPPLLLLLSGAHGWTLDLVPCLPCQGLPMGPIMSPQIHPPWPDPMGLHPLAKARSVLASPCSQLPQRTAEAAASCHAGKPGSPEGFSLGDHSNWHRVQLAGRTRDPLNRGPSGDTEMGWHLGTVPVWKDSPIAGV